MCPFCRHLKQPLAVKSAPNSSWVTLRNFFGQRATMCPVAPHRRQVAFVLSGLVLFMVRWARAGDKQGVRVVGPRGTGVLELAA